MLYEHFLKSSYVFGGSYFYVTVKNCPVPFCGTNILKMQFSEYFLASISFPFLLRFCFYFPKEAKLREEVCIEHVEFEWIYLNTEQGFACGI